MAKMVHNHSSDTEYKTFLNLILFFNADKSYLLSKYTGYFFAEN